ncbi:MAG: O-antigen ligase family protein [bacterium]
MQQGTHKRISWWKVWDWIGIFHRAVYVLLFLTLGFAIPIKNRMASWVIGFLVINWAAELRFWSKIKRIGTGKYRYNLLLFSGFYVLYLIGLLYSHNMEYGMFDIEVKLSLLVFPLLFATLDSRVFSALRVDYIFLTYILGCLAASLICMGNAFLRFNETGEARVFFYTRLSMFHHAGYFAMFLDFAIVLVIFLAREYIRYLRRWHLVLIGVLLLYFNLMVVLLSSKMGIISLMGIYVVMALVFFFRQPNRKAALYPAILLVSVIGFLLISPATLRRFERGKKAIEGIQSIPPDVVEATAGRVLIWESSFRIIREHPLFGVGTGDVKDALLKEYADKQFSGAIKLRLDAHNQYLQTFISLGLIGFIPLMLMLILPAVSAFRREDYIYFFFLLLFSLNILVESMLENQAGVVFYAFFNTLLFWSYPIRKEVV